MKKINLDSFIRTDVKNMEPYLPGISAWDLAKKYKRPIDKITKLNSNENMFGPSPLVKKELKNMAPQFYPSSDAIIVRKAIANYCDVSYQQVFIANGSDEIIDLLLRLVLRPGDEIVIFPPTFSMYEIYTKLNYGKVITVPRKSDFSLDLEKMEKRITNKTKMIFLANPNNPTGTLTSRAEIEELLKMNRLVVIDEAYFEFANMSSIDLIKKYPNAIILRTFSKWAGLAGLRIGFAVMNQFFVDQLMKIKSPFNVNLAAQEAAVITLKDTRFAKKSIRNIVVEREKMYKLLSKIKRITVYPSSANFLLITIPKSDYRRLKIAFEKKKIALRYFQSPQLGCGIRITIGRPEQNAAVLKVIKAFYK